MNLIDLLKSFAFQLNNWKHNDLFDLFDLIDLFKLIDLFDLIDLFHSCCYYYLLVKKATLTSWYPSYASLLSCCTVDYACRAAVAVAAQWAALGRLRNWQATIDNWHLLLGTTLSVWVYFDDVVHCIGCCYCCCCCPSNCSNFLKCVYCCACSTNLCFGFKKKKKYKIYAHFSPLKLCETECLYFYFFGFSMWAPLVDSIFPAAS